MTFCMWLNWHTDDFAVNTVVSMANEPDPSLHIGFSEDLFGGDYAYEVGEPFPYDDLADLLTTWRYHCFTWAYKEKFTWFTTNGDDNTLKELRSTYTRGYGDISINSEGDHVTRDGTNVVLLQEQDSVLGGFDENQLVVGAVAGFNLWNYDMTVDELNAMTERLKCYLVAYIKWDLLITDALSSIWS